MSANRPSSISRLPVEVREKIAVLRDQGRTLDEIMEVLNSLDVEISRSALGRHVKKMSVVSAEVRKTRALAEAVAREFGGQETSRVAQTNVEILHGLIMKLLIGGEGDDDVQISSKDAMLLSVSLEKLTKASKHDFDQQILAAREQERKETAEKAVDKATEVARKQGLSADVINKIKESILGVAK